MAPRNERVERFLNWTLTNLSQQKAVAAAAAVTSSSSVSPSLSGSSSSSVPTLFQDNQTAVDKNIVDLAQSFSQGITVQDIGTSTASRLETSSSHVQVEDGISSAHVARGSLPLFSTPPPTRASLLGIPYELRITIMRHVMTKYAFLSGRQQVTASDQQQKHDQDNKSILKRQSRDGHDHDHDHGDTDISTTTTTSATDDTVTANSNKSSALSSVALSALETKQTSPGSAYDNASSHMGSKTKNPKGLKWRPSERKRPPNPFSAPSSAFVCYAESRHADTALLHVCRQLRDEALPLWYAHKYYLTLIIEQGVKVELADDKEYGDEQENVVGYGLGGGRPRSEATMNQDTRTLWFNECNQEKFWKHVARDLRIPGFDVMRKFRKFHISLFVEESAFKSISQWDGIRDGLSAEHIVKILTGDGERNHGGNREHASGWIQTKAFVLGGKEEVNNDGAAAAAAAAATAKDWDYGQVKFLDHTYLKLARDAVDDANPVAESVATEENKLSVSVEMWRV